MRALVIGVGNLGSRHAQALVQAPELQEIVLVDPDDKAIEIALGRISSTGFRGKILTLRDLSHSQGNFQLAIVSTSSRERLDALRSVMRYSEFEHVLLEKLLTTSGKELVEFRRIFGLAKDKFWVNCPRPHYPHYQKIQTQLQALDSSSPVTYEVRGGNLGLVSNSIHFLDHFERLAQSRISSLEFESGSRLVDAKRRGYSEVLGAIVAKTAKGDSLRIVSDPKLYHQSLRVQIRQSSTFWLVDEAKLTLTSNFLGDRQPVESITTPLQSQLTYASLRSLTEKGIPHWASARSSLELHFWICEAISKFRAGPEELIFT